MKRQVRHGVFETNSSSCHSICISTVDEELSIPDSISFGFDDFGWEFDVLNSKREKANYLYTCLTYLGWDEIKKYIEFIWTTLKTAGVEDIDFDDMQISISPWNDEMNYWIHPSNGYVDHGIEACNFVRDVCSDEKLLLNYLFSNKSYILTGNDNDERDVEIDVDYPHEEYYKGN